MFVLLNEAVYEYGNVLPHLAQLMNAPQILLKKGWVISINRRNQSSNMTVLVYVRQESLKWLCLEICK